MEEEAAFSTIADDDAGSTLVLTGPWVVATAGAVDRLLRTYEDPVARVDLSQVSAFDTVGAWVAWRFAREKGAELVGVDDKAAVLIEAVEENRSVADIHAPRAHILERVPAAMGEFVIGWAIGVVQILGFFGAILVSLGSLLLHPSRFRVTSIVRQVELVGVSALGIIGLMSFLIGIVIAQQGAVQLAQFGAEALTVNLTGRISLRELGVLMTAIMVAGRSGSAFAAQIGTMKLTEEIDAMRTIGISPIEALVIPRILAAVFMMPLLGFYSAGMAIVGGAVISDLTLDIPFFTFLTRIQEVVPEHDLWVGLIKAPVFGLIVAMSGCYQGMQVKGNAEEVGLRTTMAVVQAIFMVIVLDAFFAVFFTEIGWG